MHIPLPKPFLLSAKGGGVAWRERERPSVLRL